MMDCVQIYPKNKGNMYNHKHETQRHGKRTLNSISHKLIPFCCIWRSFGPEGCHCYFLMCTRLDPACLRRVQWYSLTHVSLVLRFVVLRAVMAAWLFESEAVLYSAASPILSLLPIILHGKCSADSAHSVGSRCKSWETESHTIKKAFSCSGCGGKKNRLSS
jgi:hypothetical protein